MTGSGDAVAVRHQPPHDDGPYWDAQIETLPVERRTILQDHRLHWQVRRCWDGSPFYRARFESVGLTPATFRGLADLSRIPILRTGELPHGESADRPSREWTVAPDSWWQEIEAYDRSNVRVLTDGDVVQRAHQAARAIWAAGDRPGRTLAALEGRSLGTSALAIAPMGPAVAYACLEGAGYHWSDDQFLVEIVRPSDELPAEPGERGALVLTDLSREGSPLIRFWTGLEADLIQEPCACGRTSSRSTTIRPLT